MVKKNKLYMITDVHPTDSYADDDLKGVIVRSDDLEEWKSAPGWFHGHCLINYLLLGSYSDTVTTTSFYMIKVKEL